MEGEEKEMLGSATDCKMSQSTLSTFPVNSASSGSPPSSEEEISGEFSDRLGVVTQACVRACSMGRGLDDTSRYCSKADPAESELPLSPAVPRVLGNS